MATEKLGSYQGPVPNRAIVDPRNLSGTLMRLLALYAWHDRLSLSRGAGRGCTASNKLLCDRLGCDYTTLLKLRQKLEEYGYIRVETRESGRRLDTVTVVPDHLADPETWPFDQQFIGPNCRAAWGKAGETASKSANKAGGTASDAPEKAGDAISESRPNQPKTDSQYIPLSGERDLSKESKRYSSKEARSYFSKRDGAEALAASGVSIVSHLSRHFAKLDPAAKLVRFEEAFAAINRNADALESRERQTWTDWLLEMSDEYGGDPIGYHAQRLLEEVAVY